MDKQFYVGDKARYEIVSGKFWLVKVVEVKQAYGKTRYVIEPLGGGDTITTEFLFPIKP